MGRNRHKKGGIKSKNNDNIKNDTKNDTKNDANMINDPRFSKLHSDPRFVRPKQTSQKVKVDSRFKGLFEEDIEFKSTAKVDKYGRKQSESLKENLSRFYEIENEDDEDEDKDDVEQEESSEEDKQLDEESRKALIFARSRGEIDMGSESEEVSTEEEYDEVEEVSLEETEDVPRGEETRRFACLNMDWDHIKAKDLFKVFNSFKPEGGIIKSVSIYPSEFGKERMEYENLHGPPKEIFEPSDNESELSDSDYESEGSDKKEIILEDDGNEFNQEKLRKYQLERLKYYYAVVECDSVGTAKKIYDTCDGDEFESTANFFDLRFIPDSMEFDDEPRDVATQDDPSYKMTDFVTSALTNSKVSLTWDQDDPEKVQLLQKKFTVEEIDNMNFDAFLGSDSESEVEANSTREKYLNLIKGAKEDSESSENEDGEMEITFTPGISEKNNFDSEDEDQGESDEGIEDSQEKPKEETSVEKYLREARERLQKKKAAKLEKIENKKAEAAIKTKAEIRAEEAKNKAELELVLMDEEEDNKQHFDMKQVIKAEKQLGRKRKPKKGKEADSELIQDNFKIDVSDPRFTAIHESHHFAIDPTHPQFKKTNAMKEIMEERKRRRENLNSEDIPQDQNDKETNIEKKSSKEISNLVSAVKRKAEAFKSKQNNKVGKRT